MRGDRVGRGSRGLRGFRRVGGTCGVSDAWELDRSPGPEPETAPGGPVELLGADLEDLEVVDERVRGDAGLQLAPRVDREAALVALELGRGVLEVDLPEGGLGRARGRVTLRWYR